jgi:drug/metabolite transporter (DMT)-like permease
VDNTFPAIILALSAAAAWGSGDFSNGTASRRIGPFLSVLISYSFGLVALVIVALARMESLPLPIDMLWGALAGLSGMVGIIFLLRGFAIGRMGIVAPVSAVLGTAVPVIFAAFTEGLPRQLQLVGFAVALVGIWLLNRPQEDTGRPAGVGMAMVAGMGFAGFFIALSQVSKSAVFWPLVAGRVSTCAVLMVFALATRRRILPPAPALGLLALAGVLDVGGNLFFLLAIQSGRLDIATVLGSLYPAVTTILARVITKERMSALQVIGVGVSILAIVLISI